MAKRCLIVSYYFPPAGGGGVQRIVKWIKYLSRKDWAFTVITAPVEKEIIPQDSSLTSEAGSETKIIYAGSGKPVTQESVLKTALKLNISNYLKRWVSAFLFIPDSRKNWLPHLRSALASELKQHKYDCILFSIPPYSIAMEAAETAEKMDIPVILDLRDPWSANPYKIHPSKFHENKDRGLEFAAISKIPNIISAYQNTVSLYKKYINSFDDKNYIVIPNGYDEEDFDSLKAVKHDPAHFHIGFSGTFYSHLNNPAPLFKAAAALKKKNPEAGEKIRFHHIGRSMINLKKTARKFGIAEQIIEQSWLPHRKALEYLSGMDALTFILDDRCKNSGNTVGGKVYEYLRLQKPILALVPDKGEAADLIKNTNSGSDISPSDTRGIAALLADWLEKSPNYEYKNIEQFERSRQAEALVLFLEDICAGQNKTGV